MAKKRKRAKSRSPRGRWSTRDIDLLKRLFPVTATSKVAVKLRRKTDAVKKKASRMGLKKSRVYLRRIGRA
jgi:hypothetical protein